MEDIIKQICTHLEFLGYVVEAAQTDDEPDLVARGGSKPEIIMIREFGSMLLFMAAYPKPKEFQAEHSNKLNLHYVVSRCAIVDEKTVSIEASIPCFYDKKLFGLFIEEFRSEIREFLESVSDMDLDGD